MSFETTIQTAVFNALDGGLSYPVYDDAPFLPEGQPTTGFPYVVIGDDTAIAFDADDTKGMEATVTIHIWSRSHGRKEAKGILGEIYTILHRASLTAAGYSFVDCFFEFSQVEVDTDGITRHGVARYRLTIQEA